MYRFYAHKGKEKIDIKLEGLFSVDTSEIESYIDYVNRKEKELFKKAVVKFLEGLVVTTPPLSSYDYSVYAGVCMSLNKIADYLIKDM